MKILLIGEYSRLHNSLKEGLQKLGHDVVILGFNDGFKNYPVDFKLTRKWNSGIFKKVKLLILRLFNFDITSYLTYKQFLKIKHNFHDFDIVQLINENSFFCNLAYEKKILQIIFSNNKKVFLLSCGNDFINVNYNFNHPNHKSLVQPYLDGKIKDSNFTNTLKYRSDDFKKLHFYLLDNVQGIIASDMDYHIPLQNETKYLGIIPNPINIEKMSLFEETQNDKIIIFHGINRENYYKKGNNFFEKALAIIKEKYPEKVEIISVENIPYNQYINLYNKAHILLDQCYAFDQGYNALEAMSKGKVVFTGAEKEFLNHYNLQEDEVAINAKPDVDYLVEKLSMLIENPEKIIQISKNARAFIEKEHDYIQVAKKYLSVWNSN
jgi:glycosyltransferase involved in cell wall biosynthesis